MLIIPRSPSPEPLEDRDPETLTAEERLELIKRLKASTQAATRGRVVLLIGPQANQDQKRRIKLEREDDNASQGKRSHEVIDVDNLPAKRARNISAAIEEVILIDDD